MTLIADHTAERVGERHADQEDQQHLENPGQGCRVLERMRGVGIEETAAVTAEQLDHLLRSDRPARQNLIGAFQRRRTHIRAKRLRHALPHQEQPGDHADRQQHIERYSRHIDPEIADRLRGAASEAAHQRNRHGDASGGGEE